MAKRKRDMQLNFRVSAEELAVIEQKMQVAHKHPHWIFDNPYNDN